MENFPIFETILSAALACLGFLLMRLVDKIETGNVTLGELSKSVAIILVKLEGYEKRIDKLEKDSHSARQRMHDVINNFNKYDLKCHAIEEKIVEIKDRLHKINNELTKLKLQNVKASKDEENI